MAYEPTNWKTGDVVTSAKLNKLENAVANSAGENLVVHVNSSDSDYILDKTWQEIYDAYAGGNNVYIISERSADGFSGPVRYSCMYVIANTDDSIYNVAFEAAGSESGIIYSTQTPNGYPIQDK